MNDNIKAILNKASSSYQQADTSWETKTNFLNRFAELIVLECAKIAENAEPYQSSDLIKQKFGL